MPMVHAHSIVPRRERTGEPVADRLVLAWDDRHRRRLRLKGEGGTDILLDLPRATVLEDGDALRLSDGRLVAVHAADEPVMDVQAADPATLARLAWHIGNRHLPAEIRPDGIRLREDHVIATMLEGLGATVAHISAPFTPEGGAYSGARHAQETDDGAGHAHQHEHGQDHGHGHHHHGHSHAH
jgi:urease accessory protein